MTTLIEEALKLERGCDCEYDYRCGNCEQIIKVRDLAIQRLGDLMCKPRLLVKEKCPNNGCRYSRSMNQEYPRSCVECGAKEKGPTPSGAEPVCALCQKPYVKCFCIPL